jgi:hypothetical protein
MKSFFAVIAYFVAATLAAPADLAERALSVKINIANDQSGLNGVGTIPIDGVDHPIIGAFAGTGLAKAGYKGSSAQLNAFPQTHFTCKIKSSAQALLGVLTVQHTYADLDSNPNALTVVNLNGGFIRCS